MEEVARSSSEHISWTQINMYDRCSFQYKFRYIDGIKEPPNLSMANGSAGHEALQLNSETKIETGEDQPLEQLLDNYNNAFTRETGEIEKSEIRSDDNFDERKDGTVQVLTKYHAEEAPLITPLVAELPFEMPIPATEEFHDPSKPVVGKIDIIQTKLHTTEDFAIPMTRTQMMDDKFPRRLPSNLQDEADMNDQLTMYDMATTRAGKPVDEIGFQHFIPPTKTIASRLIQTYRSAAMMSPGARANRFERLLLKIRMVQKAIRDGIFIPTDKPQVCNSCGYKRMCQYSLAKPDYDKILISAREPKEWPATQIHKIPLPPSLSQSLPKTSQSWSRAVAISPSPKKRPPKLPLSGTKS